MFFWSNFVVLVNVRISKLRNFLTFLRATHADKNEYLIQMIHSMTHLIPRIILCATTLILGFSLNAQCTNFIQEDFDSFEYTGVCPFIIPGTTYQNSPQTSPGFGPNYTGNRHIYLNFQNGFVGAAFSRPYTTCIGATYRISFYHRDAWGGQNNTTFNVYDANNVLVASEIVPWTGTTWNHWVSPELTATTTTLRLEIVNNSSNLGNNDMCVDDMAIEICQTLENTTLSACNSTTPIDLFTLFNNMPVGGVWNGPSGLTNGHLGTFDPTTGLSGTYTYVLNQGGCADPTGTVEVIASQNIDLGPDQHFCTAQATTLDAGAGFDFYEWSTGATTQTISPSTAGTYVVNAGRLGANIVQNGNFQGGTTAASNNFTTAYTVGTGGTWGLLSNGGTYGVGTNPNAMHTNFSNCGDHTSGAGNMLIANGAWTPNTVVWQQTVNVTPNTDYYFSFWAMNVVNNPNVSQLQLYVNGVQIGPVNTTTTSCNWSQIADIWNSGGATQAILSIRNQSTTASGNDFAIDDISFAPMCLSTDDITISYGNHSISVTPNQTICEGNTATLTANATTPNIDFIYHWDNILTDTNQQEVTPLGTTTYTVFAEGSDGCNSNIGTTTVTIAPMPNPNAGVDQIVCIGDPINLAGNVANMNNTRAWSHDVSAVNPVPIVGYVPNNTSLATTANVNESGVYLFILSESNPQCGIYADTMEVLVSTTSHTEIITDLTCYENNTGVIEIQNTDGINYSFDDQAIWTTNPIASGLAQGNYTLWSENQYGCKFSSVVTVDQPAELLISTSNDTLVCENGTANLLAQASVPGSIFHWDFTTDLGANQQINPIGDSIVEVFAEDPNGCLSAPTQINVTVRLPLAGNISNDVTICPGYPTTIGVNGISEGLAPYSIQWSSGENGAGTTMNIQVNPPATQTYIVTITDACESTPLVLQTTVTVAPLPIPLMSSPDPSVCEPAFFTLQNETNPNMVQSVTWILSDGQFFVNQESITTEAMPAGSYDVQMIVVSPDGCVDSVTNYNYLVVYPLPTANFQWSPNPVQQFNTEVSFQNQSHLGVYFDWTFEEGSILQSNLENPKVKFPDGVTGEYDVTLVATTEHGCMDTITRTVIVLPEVLIFVPNTFTPDNDEFNQNWGIVIEGIDIYDFSLQVYNRWGEMVWESNDPAMTWDGTYNGRVVENGTYTWSIAARDEINDGKHEWQGHVNVMR